MVRLGRRAALVWIERRGRAVRAQRIWGERKEDAATKGVNGTKCQMKEREGSQKRDGGAEKGAAVGRDGGITAPCDWGESQQPTARGCYCSSACRPTLDWGRGDEHA